MAQLTNLLKKPMRTYLLSGLVVLVIGVPINYQLYSSWQKMENITSSSDVSVQSTEQSLFSESGGVGSSNHDIDVVNQSSLVISETNTSETSIEVNTPVNAKSGPTILKETAIGHAQKHANPNYVCPMHPEIVTDDPDATCPICGMDLVVLESNGEAGVVQLTQSVINTLGVRTAKVKRRTIYRRISSIGYIAVDEKSIRRVSLRTEGWIEKLMVNSIGGRVTKGDLLFQIYAPKLVNAQEEFVQALELDQGDGSMIAASKSRLRALGVSLAQIEILRNNKKVEQLISIYAPQDGVVSELSVREGDFVPPSKPVVSLVDLSSVWLMADIFENRVGWVKEGQKAEATLSFMPGKTWEGTVEYVYPSLDVKTRSIKARLRFENPGELLKPNMYANVSIFVKPKRKVLVVPREAVIRTGNQARVIVAEGEGRFKPAIIHTGIETDTKIEVMGGLEKGQEVVVSSQFLIDSESSMRAALMRLSGG